MRKQYLFSLLFISAMLFFNVACGDDKSTNQNNSGAVVEPEVSVDLDKSAVDALLEKIKTSNPEMQLDRVSKVEKAPFAGFYQLMADGDVFYVSANGDTMVVGDVISLATRQNLTEEVRKTARLDLLNTVPESDMVVYTPEDGKYEHTVTVFTDIDCGYCRKFHSELKDYLAKGIKVRYLSFPRAGKDSDSYNKAASVWCAKDPAGAMDSAKLGNDFKADDKLCDKTSVIDNSMTLVSKLGLRGTPALLFEDGTLWPGYMPADRLKLVLDNAKKKQ